MKQLSDVTGLPQSCFFKLGPDSYRTPRPNTYGIWYRELQKVWNETDNAPPGYSFQFSDTFWDKAKKMFQTLENNGFYVVNPFMISHVHGYLYRRIYFK